MAIIETDFILALASKTDKHHNTVRNLVKKIKHLKLSPYSMLELDLIIASKSIIVKLPDFYDVLDKVIAFYNISILPQKVKHLSKAYILRRKYNLSYFDSLHAATAIEENDVLISFDKNYANIKELKYMNPRKLV